MQNSGVSRLHSNTGMRAWETMLSFLNIKTFSTMRKRFNTNCICSSENYRASKKLHIDMLKEKHSHFCMMTVSGEISINVPAKHPKFKTIKVFGKDMQVTVDEYNIHCKDYVQNI